MEVRVINKSGFDLPKYETKGSAGLDLKSTERFDLYPNQRVLIHTGLFLEIPIGFEAHIRPRSGLALKHGVTVLNSPGTIDSDYRGEVGVILINHSKNVFSIHKGDRIAQMVFTPVKQVEWVETKELSSTERGASGYGSTVVKINPCAGHAFESHTHTKIKNHE